MDSRSRAGLAIPVKRRCTNWDVTFAMLAGVAHPHGASGGACPVEPDDTDEG